MAEAAAVAAGATNGEGLLQTKQHKVYEKRQIPRSLPFFVGGLNKLRKNLLHLADVDA